MSREEDGTAKDDLQRIIKKFTYDSRDGRLFKREIDSMGQSQNLLFHLLVDAYEGMRDAYTDLINGEYNKHASDKFDINELLLKVIPNTVLYSESLSHKSAVLKMHIILRR